MKRKITFAGISILLCIVVIGIIAVVEFTIYDLVALIAIVCISITIGATACYAMDLPSEDMPETETPIPPRSHWAREYLNARKNEK